MSQGEAIARIRLAHETGAAVAGRADVGVLLEAVKQPGWLHKCYAELREQYNVVRDENDELRDRIDMLNRRHEEDLAWKQRAEAAESRVRELKSLGAPPDDSEQSHYNTCRRAREWWHANTGLAGEAATGRFLLGWVLETVYAQRKRHEAQIAALTKRLEGK